MKGLIPILAVFLLLSCGSDKDSPSRKPGYAGKSGEVLIAMDRELIGSDLEIALNDAFSVPLPRNPQPEPRMDVRTVATEDMKTYSKLHRNLVIVDLGKQSRKVAVSRDVWSRGQIVLRVLAPDINTAVEVVKDKAEQMLAMVEQEERLRTMVRLERHTSKFLEDRVFNEHGVRFTIPEEYKLRGQNKHFVWLEVDRSKYKGANEHHAVQGILLYHYPFTNDSLLEQEQLTARRDSTLRRNLPGPSNGSYMSTEYKFRDIDLSPIAWEITHDGMYAVYQQGLWRMQNDFMGGPFVSLTQVDSIAGRVVTLEGFIYSPEFPKREMLREMDAIVHSLEVSPVASIKPE